MEQILTSKLHAFLVDNNPDLLITLQSTSAVTNYLEEKVSSILPEAILMLAEETPVHEIMDHCMMELTADLRPSKYHLISRLLASDFQKAYTLMRETGTLTYEIINILRVCWDVFEETPLTAENEDDRTLHYALLGCIQDYLWNTSEQR